MKSVVILVLGLAVCASVTEAGWGRRGRRPSKPSLYWLPLVCAYEGPNGVNFTKSCYGGGECSVGPLSVDHGDDQGDVTLCTSKRSWWSRSDITATDMACLVNNGTDDVFNRVCGDNRNCTVGPVTVTTDDVSVSATFCTLSLDFYSRDDDETITLGEKIAQCFGRKSRGRGSRGRRGRH